MSTARLTRLVWLAAVVATLSACGGGNSGNPTPPGPPQPELPPTGTAALTPASGWTDEGIRLTSESAGFPGTILADVTAFRLTDGRWRFIFDAGGSFRSAISTDGLALSMEPGTRVPPGAPGGPIHPRVVRLDDSRLRMFFSAGRAPDEAIYSAISTDEGVTFTLEPGVRLPAAAAGFERIGGVGIVRLRDGRWRMYTSDRGVQPVPGQPFPVTKIVSATSSDMLTWTMDEGVRIGAGAALTGPSDHPSAIVNPDGSISVFYAARPQRPGERIRSTANIGIMVATSDDGLLFTSEAFIVQKGTDFLGDPDVVRLPDGSLRVYFGSGDERGGDLRSVSRAPQAGSVLAAIDRTVAGAGPNADRIRAVSDEVIDRLSPVRSPEHHSLRERVARAEEHFRRGSHHAVTEAAVVGAMNAVAASAGVPAFMNIDTFRSHRRQAESHLPGMMSLNFRAASDGAGMSPMQALTYALSLLKDEIDGRAPGLGWLAYRKWLEHELDDESSQTSWLAHDILTAAGVRR